ncbi:VWA domain-containing protein [Candidatus Woesearchaeota archaeon]|nr:VWA domain-containing protein [Candidatus Woesearchaeota archaeon]
MEIVFQYPMSLLLFLVVPVLIVLHYYFFEHNKKRAMKFANFSAMKRVTGTHLITKNTGQLVIRVIVISLFTLGTAHPVMWYEGKSSTTDYVLAIDTSASMVAEDVLPDRLTVAKQAAASFIDNLEAQTEIGLISFSGVSYIKSPLTTGYGDLKDKLSMIEIQLSGGTDIGSALITATNLLASSKKSKSVILITDGSDTSGVFVEDSVQTAVEYVADSHVVVHTIAIGTGIGKAGYVEDLPLGVSLDLDSLRYIADRTGGMFYEVKSTAEIASAFSQIENHSEEAPVSVDLYPYLMAFAIVLLLVEWGLLNTKFRAIP